MKKYIGGYKNSMPLPSDETSKNYKWFLAMAESAWSLYCTDRMSMRYGGQCDNSDHTIEQQRAYLFNKQSIQPIIDIFDPKDEKTGERLLKFSFAPVDYHTTSLSIGSSRIQAFNYAPKTVAIDENSLKAKTIRVNKAKFMAIPEMAGLIKEAGYEDEDGLGLDDANDVDALAEMGSIGLKAEIDLKNAVDHCFSDCNFKLVLQPMFIRDIITSNRCVGVVEDNIETGRPHVKYVDIERAFYTPSVYPDHRDSTIGGYIEAMSIPMLRQYLTKENTKGNTKYGKVEDVLHEIANTYEGKGNKYPDGYDRGGGLLKYQKENSSMPYDNFSIEVATIYFIATDTQTYVHGISDAGQYEYRRTKNTAVAEEGKTIEKHTLQNVYRVRWIIGTDYIFDYGVDNKIVRAGKKGNKKAKLPMIMYTGIETSLIDRIIPKIDDINKLEYKERQVLNEMIPQPMFTIDISLMEEVVNIAGQNLTVRELLYYFKKKGVFIYKSKNEFGEQEGGSQRSPIEFVNSPEVRQIIELAQKKSITIQEMKSLIGINEIADGTQTSPELLVGVSNNANQAVNNALMPFILSFRQFYTSLGRMIMNKIEVALQQGETIEGVYIDKDVAKEYKLSAEPLSQKAEYAFTLEITLSQEEKTTMMQAISQAYAKGELTTSEFITASSFINNDDIKAARLFMAKAERKAQEVAHKRQMETVQGQAQAQGDAAVKAEEAKANFTTSIDNNKHKNELEKLGFEHNYKMQQIQLDKSLTQEADMNKADNALLHESVKQTLIGEQKNNSSI